MSKSKKTIHGSLFTTHKYLYWLPSIFYMILIFILSSCPAPEVVSFFPTIFGLDTSHMLEYGLLAILYSYALQKTSKANERTFFLLPVLLAFLYGITDEIHQMFVITRSSTVNDLIANFTGAALFQLLFFKLNI
ncbi:MAG: VanZ family protein, partial [Candidatus Margulisbacteria bacterium]|nr:VanZ family protein [Candidatus Margulisiibacteriota bacterium]